MTKLIFTQNVIGSRFDAQPTSSGTFVGYYGWTSSKGQQEIDYSVNNVSIPEDKLEAYKNDMPYVTEEITTEFYSEQVYDTDGKPTAESCTLHDFCIGKFGELNLYFRVHDCGDELFRVKVQIDAISTEDLKSIRASSSWFVKVIKR